MAIPSSKKTVWIINQYASNPEVGMGGRHYYLGKALVSKGYDVNIITSSNHHLLRSNPAGAKFFSLTKSSGINYVWLRLFKYQDAHSKIRVLNWFLFPLIFLLISPLIRQKPDVIIYSSPSPIGSLGAELLSNLYRSKYFFEIRDIWPLTLVELGGYSESNVFIKLLRWIEKRGYRKCDAVLSNLKNIQKHIDQSVSIKVNSQWIPNGFSAPEMASGALLREEVRARIPVGKFVIGYAGSIGISNALENLINIAMRLRDHSNLAFVIVGDGKQKKALLNKVEDLNLVNVTFIEPVPKAEIPALLKSFDVNYIGWNDEAVYRFGIGANKIPEYMFSGRPVIHAYSGACDPISCSGCGISVPAQDLDAIERAVLRLSSMEKRELQNLGSKGKKAAEEIYEYSKIATSLERVLFDD